MVYTDGGQETEMEIPDDSGTAVDAEHLFRQRSGHRTYADKLRREARWMQERLGIHDTAELRAQLMSARQLGYEPVKSLAGKLWESIGPANLSGRVGCLAIDPRFPDTVYAAASGGGVWRTDDGGMAWTPCMQFEVSLTIGGLAVAASCPTIVYAGTGEWTGDIGTGVDPVTSGIGVYKSHSSGKTWSLCAPIASTLCSVVVVSEVDADIVYVGGERALHRSRDGGATWDVPVGSQYGLLDGEVSDVALDPSDSRIIFVAMNHKGFFRSLDGGASWIQLTNGLPTGWRVDGPKIALGRNGPHKSRFITVKSGDLIFVSDDAGNSFRQVADLGDKIFFYGWCNLISVHPDNEDLLIAGSNNLHRSEDGGQTWLQVGGYGTNVHPDHHRLVWSLRNGECYVCTDGGIWRSKDFGRRWRWISHGLIGGHFFVMSTSQTKEVRLAGSVQDDDGYISGTGGDWQPLARGEGGYVEFDPLDPSVIYHDTWWKPLARSDDAGSTWIELGVDTDDGLSKPLAIRPDRPRVLLAATQTGQLALSEDRGQSWSQVGVPRARVRCVAFAHPNSDLAFAAGDDRSVIVSYDGGKTWSQLDTSALPQGNIHALEVDPANPDTFYIIYQGASGDRVFCAQLGGTGSVGWTSMSEGSIFAACLVGVYKWSVQSQEWARFGVGLPNVVLSDIDFCAVDKSIYVSSLGRGIFRYNV
jgi:photosystem II stability/assembly factor-like uncharacterized protein